MDTLYRYSYPVLFLYRILCIGAHNLISFLKEKGDPSVY